MVEGWKQRVVLLVTFSSGEKSANLSPKNGWSFLCCFMEQSLILINDPEKGMHTE